ACVVAAAAPAAGPDASAWVTGHGSRVRLVAGVGTERERWAGVEIGLDPGFKTYWRDPGESGLPPAFDWSRSENVAGLELWWPARDRGHGPRPGRDRAAAVRGGTGGLVPRHARPDDAVRRRRRGRLRDVPGRGRAARRRCRPGARAPDPGGRRRGGRDHGRP